MIKFDVERKLKKALSESSFSAKSNKNYYRKVKERRVYPDPSQQAIANYIDEMVGTSIRAAAGNHIIRYMWKNADFDFEIDYLNIMARSVRSLGTFSSWDEFYNKFSDHRYYKLTEKFMGVDPDYITSDDWQYIRTKVHKIIEQIYSQSAQEGRVGIGKHNVFYEDSRPNVVRLADEQDIKHVSNLAERVYPCPYNDADVRAAWHQKNRKICLVCFDPHGDILGTLTAFPITRKFYEALKKGETSEGKMTPDDILALDEKQQVECIYIESFAALSVKVQYELRRVYLRMFANFCDIENDQITVCAIAGSVKSKSVLEGYGMKTVSEVPEPRAGKFFPFFETTLGNFKTSLEKKIAETETVYDL